MADSQGKKPSVGDGIKAGLFGISGYSGRSAPRNPTLRTITREHVAKADLAQFVNGFIVTGAKVITTSDGPDTFKLVATWDN
jgi:hypothetical protein